MTINLRILISSLALMLMYSAVLGQHRSTEEFMQSLGFTSSGSNVWKNTEGVSVEMDGDQVKSFTAPQTHTWEMVFGDGSTLGKTIKLNTGDVVVFKEGRIAFGKGPVFKLLSTDNEAKTSRGLLKSAIFNKERNTLSAKDIKIVNGESYSLGWLNLTGKEDDDQALDENGNIMELVLAQQEAEMAKRAEANQAWEQAKADDKKKNQESALANYEAYCQKYGRNNIDRTIAGDIVVGVPWELLQKVIDRWIEYKYEEISSNGNMTRYRITPIYKEPNEWYKYYLVDVDNNTGLIDYYKRKRTYYKGVIN